MTNTNIGTKIFNGLKWFLKSFIWIIPLLLVLDIITKLGFERLLQSKQGWAITVIPNFFRFALVYNEGAAWGMLEGQDWLLITISSVAGAAMIGYLVWKYKTMPFYLRICLCVIIPGCLGNLIDRAFYPHGVIDFLEFTFGSYRFPTFNLADSYIVVGIILLIIFEIVAEYKIAKAKSLEKMQAINEEELTKDIKNFEKEAREEKDDESTDDDSRED